MLTNVKAKAEEMGMDAEKVKLALKSVQSQKCRLAKQKNRKDYDIEMTKVLQEEQLLKEVRAFIVPKKLTVTTMTQEQINDLDFEQTVRALKSIQSKKCLTQYDEDLVEFNHAVTVEAMLKEHREQIKPNHDTTIRKSDINDLLEQVEGQKKVDKNWLLEQLLKLKG